MEVDSKRFIQIPARDTSLRGKTIKGWIKLSRPPFHLVGLFPFIVGALLAWHIYGVFNWTVFGWSAAAVILIMLSTYYNGEYYDLKEDKLSAEMDRNVFSGGTQVIVKNLLPHKQVKIAGYITLVLAGIIGLILHFHYKSITRLGSGQFR
jgi:1,4-dihydroxy-2-naphthoate octaprenyltransferase